MADNKIGKRALPPSIDPGIPRLPSQPPAGWTRYRVGDLFDVVERPVTLVSTREYQLVVARRSRGGIESRSRLLGSQIKVKQQYAVEADDFLISNRQISHGGCGVVPPALAGSIVSGEYTVLHPKRGLLLGFLEHYVHSRYFQQICFHSSVGVHVEKLVFRPDVWMSWPIDLPSEHEQRYIAAMLSECDRAIATTEALVEAKRRVKRVFMQQFTSEGDTRRLTDVATVLFSGVDKKSVAGEHSVHLCNYMDVYANTRIVAEMAFMPATATDSEIRRFQLQAGDVLFTKDSETADDIAASAYVPDDLPGVVCGYHLGIARPKRERIHGGYLAFAMRTPAVLGQFSRAANGVVRFGLTLDAMDKVEIRVPSLPRQAVVASALTAADTEIDLLAAQAQALRRQKRGLMQKLLTGQWRVGENRDREAAE